VQIVTDCPIVLDLTQKQLIASLSKRWASAQGKFWRIAVTQNVRPLPSPTPETQMFWDSCRNRAMELPQCQACRKFHFYPRSMCPYCWSRDLKWVQTSGLATLYSYVISHRALAGFESVTPYVIAVVELEEGVRMMTNLVGVKPDPCDISIDMALRVSYQDVSEVSTLPNFAPA